MATFVSRLRGALRVLIEAQRFLADPVFDAEWYRWRYPDAPRSRRAAARHYVLVGVEERRIPSPGFDPQRYARHNADVDEAGFDPVRHFLTHGRAEQRYSWPTYQRSFLGGDGRLDRDALDSFLRSGALRTGTGSVLHALPHLLHAIPAGAAADFGDILVALASDRRGDLRRIAQRAPHGAMADVSVTITGEAGILAEATLAALMVGGEIARDHVAMPGETPPDAEVHVEVRAGALVLPGSLGLQVSRARLGPVDGIALQPDGTRFVGWESEDAAAPRVMSARATRRDLADGPEQISTEQISTEQLGGGAAIWWPRVVPAPADVQRPRALVLDFRVPTPDLDSGSLCSVSYMRTLTGLGFRVVFVPQDSRYHARYTPELESWGVEVVDERYADALPTVLERVRFELAVIVRPSVFAWAADRIRSTQPDARMIFAPLDLNHVRLAAQAAYGDDARLAEAAEVARVGELEHVRRADATIVLSSFEVEQLRSLVPTATVALVPMARDGGTARPIDDWSQRRDLVFLGSYTHLPNIDGITWFLSNVWPEVAGRLPDARFVAYGSEMPAELRALASERVVMHGYITRLEDAFVTARLSVVPLRFGAGVKGKVTSTMLAGIPIVSTDVGTEGMDLSGEAIVVANGAREFADATVALWNDESRLTALSAASLGVASERFSFAAQAAALSDLLFALGVASAKPELEDRR